MIKTAEKNDRIVDCFAKNTYEVPKILKIIGTNMPVPSPDSFDSKNVYGCFRILSQKDGDKRVVWNRMVMAEIKAAKKMFMDLLKQGMVPYKVGVDGKAMVEEMQEFDATAEEVIFMPVKAVSGG